MRHADQETIAAREKRDQDLVDHRLLAENETGNCFACLAKAIAQLFRQGFGLGDIHVVGVDAHDALGFCGHLQWVPLS